MLPLCRDRNTRNTIFPHACRQPTAPDALLWEDVEISCIVGVVVPLCGRATGKHTGIIGSSGIIPHTAALVKLISANRFDMHGSGRAAFSNGTVVRTTTVCMRISVGDWKISAVKRASGSLKGAPVVCSLW